METNQLIKLYRSQGDSHTERVKQILLHLGSRQIWAVTNAYRHHYFKYKYDVPTSPYRTISVEPSDVGYVAKTGYSVSKEKGAGRILDNWWGRIPLEEHQVYQGLHERFVEGKEWEETVYVQGAREKFDEGIPKYGYNGIDAFIEKRCQYVDDLYRSIKTNGYRPDRQSNDFPDGDLRNRNHTHDMPPLICVDHKGRILIRDGRHRFVLCNILDVDSIPVLVLARRMEWQQVREQCYNCDSWHDLPDRAKENPNHPDLIDVPERE